ncbi:MAG: hypothetical protein ACJ72U_17145 [Nitrososphaeraceae archaeon]
MSPSLSYTNPESSNEAFCPWDDGRGVICTTEDFTLSNISGGGSNSNCCRCEYDNGKEEGELEFIILLLLPLFVYPSDSGDNDGSCFSSCAAASFTTIILLPVPSNGINNEVVVHAKNNVRTVPTHNVICRHDVPDK